VLKGGASGARSGAQLRRWRFRASIRLASCQDLTSEASMFEGWIRLTFRETFLPDPKDIVCAMGGHLKSRKGFQMTFPGQG
jgi:hypothetical protein